MVNSTVASVKETYDENRRIYLRIGGTAWFRRFCPCFFPQRGSYVAEMIVPDMTATPVSKGLFGRVVGVLISPRDTYADIARRPTWVGIWLIVVVVTTVCAGWLSSTPVGRRAAIEETTKVTTGLGIQIPQAQLDAIHNQIMNAPVWKTYAQTGGATLILVPLVGAITAGILLGIFNALMGGDAKFKQLYAVCMFSNAIILVKTIFVTPLNYARESLSNPTTFAALLPMLDENSLPAKMLGSIDFFWLWWLFSLAVGLGVLYKRPTRGIATSLISVYVVLAVTIAAGFALIRGSVGG
jgi:Yip1 domain